MILQSFWEQVSDKWLSSKMARRLFGAATAMIVIITIAFYLPIPPDPPVAERVLLGLVGILSALSVFFLWSGMWCYWIRRDPSSRFARRVWFVVLLVGFWYGAAAYYLCVYLPGTRESVQERAA